jgi:CRP-like cAMP-binding protein
MSGRAALTRFIDRLSLHTDLTAQEQAAVLALPVQGIRADARVDLVSPGQHVDHALLVGEGLLGRFDQMADGARQITALHIPGDMCDLQSFVSPTAGWGITALGSTSIFQVPHAGLRDLIAAHPALTLALWRDTVLDASILAKWVANVGRKSARARIAHLLCEMGIRKERAQLGDRRSYMLRMTQEQIGDAMGLTPVHVNRTLRTLSDAGVVTMQNYRVQAHDWDRLAEIADFQPLFLLERDRARRARAAPAARAVR